MAPVVVEVLKSCLVKRLGRFSCSDAASDPLSALWRVLEVERLRALLVVRFGASESLENTQRRGQSTTHNEKKQPVGLRSAYRRVMVRRTKF